MGDYVKEFGRILKYKNELLRSKPKSTCVVKFGDTNKLDRQYSRHFTCILNHSRWHSCYGVCRGQLFIVVDKDDNNQMLPCLDCSKK
ncbi:hypothetical protein H5410_004313 [Solanum commersonii]|uniref:Uncharacterized protein n=1 Tax=Solanum commersonii TaxID=4109 RepID=A0A9J6B7R5_SOLCO|nr:hypothetical protein H5410_004313 [Solanum commersonii]